MNGTLDKVLALKKVKTFSGLLFEDLVALARIALVREMPTGTVVIREGDRGATLYVVLSGEVEVLQESADGLTQLAKIGAGGYFGELSIFDDQPRSATVKVRSDAVLLQIQKQQFHGLLAMRLNLSFEMLRTFAERFRKASKESHENT